MVTNLEVFVTKELDLIQKQASNASEKYWILGESCRHVKGIVQSYGESKSEGKRGMNVGTTGALPEEVTVPLLSLLQSCLQTKNTKFVEPALACIHKLVAYAYIQGETRGSGRLDDVENTVTMVVTMAARAAQTAPNASVQLTAVKTLLTATTAEHFIPHGDCLMLAVRTAFNIAINGGNRDVCNAAASALLQMMNTILKRVAHQIVSPIVTRRQSAQVGNTSQEVVLGTQDATSGGIPPDMLKGMLQDEAIKRQQLSPIRTTQGGVVENILVAADQRAAQLSQMAERSDLKGLEVAMTETPGSALKVLDEKSVALKHDSNDLIEERSLSDGIPKVANETPSSAKKLARTETPPDPRRALMRDARAPEWRALTVTERDIVIVFSAMCKMASRETGSGAAGTYFHSGKLLALETIVKVMSNPIHDWEHIRPELAMHLRQPICLTVLRNCKSPYETAVTASVSLLCAMLSAPSLRLNLKAEIGALYPLVLLRPLESSNTYPSLSHQALAAVKGLESLCSSPQILVDIFVNFDCSLQSSNLFERTIHVLGRESCPGLKKAADGRDEVALQAILKCIDSLDTWAGPLKPLLGNASETNLVIDETGEDLPGRESSRLHEDVLRKLHLDKAKKSSLKEGVAFFNSDPVRGIEYLVHSDVIEGDPKSIAAFLLDETNALDSEAIGELLGHHSDASIEVMHAYIRKFNFASKTVDEALRQLLRGFRLPGEAQKIDRIMEKFAEKYCEDNPNAFPIADAAYLLAFAIIMLNTDAHNPMAERRIGPEDFVAMCTYQTESGDYDQILPTDDLLQLHERIVREEIAVPESRVKQTGQQETGNPLRRLAAAAGLSRLVAPFHAGNSWDKRHGAEKEASEYFRVSAELFAAKGSPQAQNIWITATHSEHARPMMQVAGDSLARSLSFNLRTSKSIAQAMPILKGYEQAIKLSALLWLEALAESLVQGLGAGAGFGLHGGEFDASSYPAPGSPEEAKSVAALSRLVGLGSCKEAGLLGSAWVTIFRILSSLEMLKQSLSPSRTPTSLSPRFSWVSRSHNSPRIDGEQPGTRRAGRRRETPVRTVMRQEQGPLSIREEPGMGLIIWAETSGISSIDKIFLNSSNLDGESILTFIRALCAISQEELDPVDDSSPKVYLLQRVVECAYFNSGRMRIVWQRIWTVVSQHLVSAACSLDSYVAMFAVDSLRQLADKLLCRAELAGFAAQGDAIRPLGSILRCSDSVSVRELTIACVDHIVDAHRERIGGGWWAVIDALAVAAADSSLQVIGPAVDIMIPVFEVLYKRNDKDGLGGHECLLECVTAALAAVGNSACGDDLAPATTSLELFQTLCQNIAESEENANLVDSWIAVLGPLAVVARVDPRPEIADTAASVLFFSLSNHSPKFSKDIWMNVFPRVIQPLLSLHPADAPPDIQGYLCESPMEIPQQLKITPLRRPRPRTLSTGDLPSPMNDQLSVEGALRVGRHANSYLPTIWEFMKRRTDLRSILLQPCLDLIWSYSLGRNAAVSEYSGSLCKRMLSYLAKEFDSDEWVIVLGAMARWIKAPSVDVALALPKEYQREELRRRCNSQINGFYIISWLLESCQLPGNLPFDFLATMKDAIKELRMCNEDKQNRESLASIMNETSIGLASNISKSTRGHDISSPKGNTMALVDAVVDSIQSEDDPVLPAFGRNETIGEKVYVETILKMAAESNSCSEKLYGLAVEFVVGRIQESYLLVNEKKGGLEKESNWLEATRIYAEADYIVALGKIPIKYWSQHKADMIHCVSALVKSDDFNVRKGCSAFFASLSMAGDGSSPKFSI